MGQGTKLIIEAGPLAIFFVANLAAGPYWATGLFMVATAISLAIIWIKERKVSMVAVVGAAFVGFFGALTFWFDDKSFIQIKITAANLAFGAVLAGGLLFKKPLLRNLMQMAIKLTDDGWRTLTVRWMVFFFAVAAANEFVRHAFSFDQWAYFKIALLPLSLAFAVAQAPMMIKHSIPEDPAPPSA